MDVVACSISIFLSNPAHLLCQIRTVRFSELPLFEVKDETFAGLAQVAIPIISLDRVELPHEPL